MSVTTPRARLEQLPAGVPVRLSVRRDGVEVHCVELVDGGAGARVATTEAVIMAGDVVSAFTPAPVAPYEVVVQTSPVDGASVARCGCGWRGGVRVALGDACADAIVHADETGHPLAEGIPGA